MPPPPVPVPVPGVAPGTDDGSLVAVVTPVVLPGTVGPDSGLVLPPPRPPLPLGTPGSGTLGRVSPPPLEPPLLPPLLPPVPPPEGSWGTEGNGMLMPPPLLELPPLEPEVDPPDEVVGFGTTESTVFWTHLPV